jgi:hypothetical protein
LATGAGRVTLRRTCFVVAISPVYTIMVHPPWCGRRAGWPRLHGNALASRPGPHIPRYPHRGIFVAAKIV